MTRMHDPAARTILDPAVVARLGRLEVIARTLVEGFIKGLHLSPSKGSSTEFAEHRPYSPGDEIRRIDWRTFARTDRHYLKEYDDETNVRAILVVDKSKSTAFPEDGLTKFRYAVCTAAALGYLVLRQRDGVGLAMVSDRVERFLPPKATAQHLSGIFKTLEEESPSGTTGIGRALTQIAARTTSRSLVILISDFLDEPHEILKGLSELRHRGCEVLVLHTIDPTEETFPFTNWTVFRDPEDAAVSLRMDARQVVEIYQDTLRAHLELLKKGCAAAAVDYSLVRTDTPFEDSLATYLETRSRRKRGVG